jgi:hypothetical protein
VERESADVTAFFEIHDSKLMEVREGDSQVTLRLKVIRTEWETPEMEGVGTCFTQEIELHFENAIIQPEAEVPMWLLDGSFHADTDDAKPEDVDAGDIPASLREAKGVRLRLEGMNEANEDYFSIEVHGTTMHLTPLSEPKFLQTFRPESSNDS